jgi:hypothetical protein
MNLKTIRYGNSENSTPSLLMINGKFTCFVLEDEARKVKVRGETRIPAGLYQVKFREVDSPLTLKYRKRFPDDFTYHLELQNVPGFQFVYMHIGNTDDDSDGCLLLGNQAYFNDVKQGFSIGQSTQAFLRVYKQVSDALNKGERVWIQITEI